VLVLIWLHGGVGKVLGGGGGSGMEGIPLCESGGGERVSSSFTSPSVFSLGV
jgi:hypothetical protein